MSDRKAIILLSGGLDSAITALYLRDKRFQLLGGIFVDRGQSSLGKEIVAAKNIADRMEIPLFQTSFSTPEILLMLDDNTRKKIGIPGRNAIFGTLAFPYLYVLDCQLLVIGNVSSDVFPDCNKDFRAGLGMLATQALRRPTEVVAPFADWENLDKAGEILYAIKNGHEWVFAQTWTCWYGKELQCGMCGTCKYRRSAFKTAGVVDPTTYEEGQ